MIERDIAVEDGRKQATPDKCGDDWNGEVQRPGSERDQSLQDLIPHGLNQPFELEWYPLRYRQTMPCR